MAQQVQMMSPYGADRILNGRVYISDTSGIVAYYPMPPVITVDLYPQMPWRVSGPGLAIQIEDCLTSKYIPDGDNIIITNPIITEAAPAAGQNVQMRVQTIMTVQANKAPKVNVLL